MVVVSYVTCSRMRQIQAHEIHHDKGLDVRLSEHPSGGGQGSLISLPLPQASQEDMRLDGYLEYRYAAKASYIYKHPCLLRDSNPRPTALQSAFLTPTPDE
ncbi:hypothetical protein TNCV_3628201 [Trichonephila clavipes]|nr:hypothetical protein TNCV_3628201 [Trichonephila clavipes]